MEAFPEATFQTIPSSKPTIITSISGLYPESEDG